MVIGMRRMDIVLRAGNASAFLSATFLPAGWFLERAVLQSPRVPSRPPGPCRFIISMSLQAQEHFAEPIAMFFCITMMMGYLIIPFDDIYKDTYGFLWISTAGGGLSRYDGYEFIHFNPNTPHCKLKSNFIHNVYEDRFHRLWIVSEGGTDIIDLSTLQSVVPNDPKGLLPRFINQPTYIVILDSQGCIWLQCDNALHRISFNAEGDINTLSTLDLPELFSNCPCGVGEIL